MRMIFYNQTSIAKKRILFFSPPWQGGVGGVGRHGPILRPIAHIAIFRSRAPCPQELKVLRPPPHPPLPRGEESRLAPIFIPAEGHKTAARLGMVVDSHGVCRLREACFTSQAGRRRAARPPDQSGVAVDIAAPLGSQGFVYAYEQTAIYPKVAGYIKKWSVDIGDPIKKDQEIATLYVPELEAELLQKRPRVEMDETQVLVAERMVEVATNNVKVAAAQIDEAKAGVNKFQASVDRWESEVKRLSSLSEIVDKQILSESTKQLKADTAAPMRRNQLSLLPRRQSLPGNPTSTSLVPMWWPLAPKLK